MALQNDPLRILVVDDNQEAADLLAEVLSMHGHVATAVYGGAQGLSAMIDLAPDVVFLDLGMPGMDGYQVAQRLRAMREVVRLAS
nr:response regulator [uncultured Duganella sp.]